jgi:uncharacterized C2H2 Zn-finger protein
MQQTVRCPDCGREFPTQQALQEHINRDHMGTMTDTADTAAPESRGGASQQECPSCSAEFPSLESVTEHRRSQHAWDPSSTV